MLELGKRRTSLMNKLANPKTYSLVVGLLLFTFGIVGFAFRNSFDLGDKYLIFSMVLGFWGIISAFAHS